LVDRTADCKVLQQEIKAVVVKYLKTHDLCSGSIDDILLAMHATTFELFTEINLVEKLEAKK